VRGRTSRSPGSSSTSASGRSACRACFPRRARRARRAAAHRSGARAPLEPERRPHTQRLKHVLPSTGAPRPRRRSPPAPAAEPPPTESGGRPVALTLANLDHRGGQVAVLDRTTKPFYQGRVSAIRLAARGLSYPENGFDDFALSLRAPGNARSRSRHAPAAAHPDRRQRRAHPAHPVQPLRDRLGLQHRPGRASFARRRAGKTDRYDSADQPRLRGSTWPAPRANSLRAGTSACRSRWRSAHARRARAVIALTIPVQRRPPGRRPAGRGRGDREALRTRS